MSKISPEFEANLRANPKQNVAVIIKTSADPATASADLSAAGLNVTRTFKLISAMAANGPAEAVLAVAEEPWVISIEPDREVHTM